MLLLLLLLLLLALAELLHALELLRHITELGLDVCGLATNSGQDVRKLRI